MINIVEILISCLLISRWAFKQSAVTAKCEKLGRDCYILYGVYVQ